MCSYEIRLRKNEGRIEETYHVRRVNDFAAIRNARQIAEEGDIVEVWKGGDCIYADLRLPSVH